MATQTVDKLDVRSFDQPDETRTPDKSKIEIVNSGEVTIGRFTFQPGWTWAECIKPVAGTDHCQSTHVGYAVSGELEVWTPAGDRKKIRGGDAYLIPPGHDAKVIGDKPFAGIEFVGAATYAKK